MHEGNNTMIFREIERANDQKRPLYLPVVATRPCFVKMASLVQSLQAASVPHLVVASGQHYDSQLTGPLSELGYAHRVAWSLDASGPMLQRQAKLACELEHLAERLRQLGLRQPAVPMVSGDTWTAGFLPASWLMHTGVRSIHVEAGLRSEGPVWSELPGDESVLRQRECRWVRYPDDPFPEGVCTRLASVASGLLLAPTRRNAGHLLLEGADPDRVVVVGSLSADAINGCLAERDALAAAHAELLDAHPRLATGCWLRVDLHRRENMVPTKLVALLRGIASLAGQGLGIILVETNSFRQATARLGLEAELRDAVSAGVLMTSSWPSYRSVVAFLDSAACLGVYTDSGGFQEESHMLGIACMTARASTDRAETVLDATGNVLIPLISAASVAEAIGSRIASSGGQRMRPGWLYGERVGQAIVQAVIAAEDSGIDHKVHRGMLDWA